MVWFHHTKLTIFLGMIEYDMITTPGIALPSLDYSTLLSDISTNAKFLSSPSAYPSGNVCE